MFRKLLLTSNPETLDVPQAQELFSWGDNSAGETGLSDYNHRSSPVQVGLDSWVQIDAEEDLVAAIRSDGKIYSWGKKINYSDPNQVISEANINQDNYITPTLIDGNYWKKIAVSRRNIYAIKSDNTLWAMGDGRAGQLGQPKSSMQQSWVGAQPTSFTYGATTYTNKRPLEGMGYTNEQLYTVKRNDGTVWGWGYYNDWGYWGDGTSWTGVNQGSVYKGRSFFTQVAAGPLAGGYSWSQFTTSRYHTLALRSDGSAWAWGYNGYGQLGTLDTISRSSPVQVGTSSWIMVCAGDHASIFLRTDRKLFTCGYNGEGELGLNNTTSHSSPMQVGSSSWTFVEAGLRTMYAIDILGRLFAWGNNNNGKLGIGAAAGTHYSSPVQVAGGTSFVMVTGKYIHAYAITSTGALYGWGYNGHGELCQNDTTDRTTPHIINNGYSYTMVAAGNHHGLALRNTGHLFHLGRGTEGQNGVSWNINYSSPVQIGTDNDWEHVGCGHYNSYAIKTNGSLWAWGYDNAGILGFGTQGINKSSPTQINSYASGSFVQIGTSSWSQISSKNEAVLGITVDGKMHSWGNNIYGQTASITTRNSIRDVSGIDRGKLEEIKDEGYFEPVKIDYESSDDWEKIAIGKSHALAINIDGTLWAWGDNDYGQLGTNDLLHRSSPVQIASGSWTGVAVGTNHSLALKSDGSMYSWGRGDFNQHGVSDGDLYIKEWVGGSLNNYIIKSNGTLWAWGYNHVGQLGTNDTIHRSSPVQIGSESNWASVTAGDSYALALKTDGSLYSWGSNGRGNLGHNDIIDRSSPVQIGSATSWRTLPSNLRSLVGGAIDNNGILWTWGNNDQGRLGTGDTTHRSSPVQVMIDKSWKQLILGYACGGLLEDGTLWTWGYNTRGELGQNDTVHRSSPVQVGTDSYHQIGFNHAFVAIKNTGQTDSFGQPAGSLWAWGRNEFNQVGDNTTAHRSSPVQISSDRWRRINSNYNGSGSAIRHDGYLYIWGNNLYGQAGNNGTASYVNFGTIFYAPTTNYPNVVNAFRSLPKSDGDHKVAFPENRNMFAPSANVTDYFNFQETNSDYYIWGRGTEGQLGNIIPGYDPYFSYGNPEENLGLIINRSSPVFVTSSDKFNRSSPVQLGTDSWITIDAGEHNSAAIRTDGKLYAWGNNLWGQIGEGTNAGRIERSAIDSSNSYVQVSVGGNFIASIRSDGRLLTSGYGTEGALGTQDYGSSDADGGFRSEPVQLSEGSWAQVTQGRYHTLALAHDGTIWSWGYNALGMLGDGTTENRSSPVQIGSDTNWAKVFSGYSHSYAIKSDATLWAWGKNDWGMLGQDDTIHRSSPVQIAGSWTTIFSHGAHSAGIKTDGSLWVWGNNNNGRLGLNDLVHRSSPVQLGTDSWSLIGGGSAMTAGIKTNGTLWTWGNGQYGRTGLGTEEHRSEPVQVGAFTDWKFISGASEIALFAIRGDDNLLYGWGYADHGLGEVYGSSTEARTSPVIVGEAIEVTSWNSVATGRSHTVAIRSDGKLYAWGRNDSGQVGDGTNVHRSSPIQITSGSFIRVTAGDSHSGAIRSDGKLYMWGGAASGQVGDGGTTNRNSPTLIGSTSWTTISAGGDHTLGITTDGILYTWGKNDQGQLGDGGTTNRNAPGSVGTSIWSIVSAGQSFSTAIRNDGAMFAWGLGSNGQLADFSDQTFSGVNNSSNVSTPTQINNHPLYGYSRSFNDVINWGGGTHYIDTNYQLWYLGSGSQGQSGLGDLVHRSSPVQVAGGGSWTWIYGGQSNVAGIKSDGTMWAWGRNDFRQLADGTQEHRSNPVQIGVATSWHRIWAGTGHMIAMDTSNTLWTWGDNTYGQLGIAKYPGARNRSTPVQVDGAFPSSWSQVVAGDGFTAMLKTNGTLWMNGFNTNGELGQNDTTHRSSPVQVTSGTGSWTQLNAGRRTMYALSTSGELYGWGYNTNGELGVSDVVHRSSAVVITSDKTWLSITQLSSGQHMMAIRDDGSLWGWGRNTYGQLGDTTTAAKSSPIQIDAGSWLQVACGNEHSLGIKNDYSIWSWGRSNNGQGGNNSTANILSPTQIGTSSWTVVNAGDSHSVAIRVDGSLWAWGADSDGQLGQNSIANKSSPVQVGTDTDWVKVGGGLRWTVAQKTNGSVWAWGNNAGAQLSQDDQVHRSSPVQLGGAGALTNWTVIAPGYSHLSLIDSNYELFGVGRNDQGELGTVIDPSGSLPYSTSPIQLGTKKWTTAGHANYSSTSAIDERGRAFVWGRNDLGYVGDNTAEHRSSPVQVRSDDANTWVDIATSLYVTSALRSDNTLWAWGENSYGLLQIQSDGTVIEYSSPTLVGSQALDQRTSWSQVSVGWYHSLLIRSDGLLFASGRNDFGQLGNLSTVHRSSPVQVGTDSWTQVVAGGLFSMGIKTDGRLYAWGINEDGVFGDNSTQYTRRSSPVQVSANTDWSQIQGGYASAYAIKTDGSLWAWGDNTFGQLGDGSLINRSSPIQVGTSSWSLVKASSRHAAGITVDKKLYTWGYNLWGQLGHGDRRTKSSPVQVGSLSWNYVDCGESNSAAVRSDTTLWTWGADDYGQLGQYPVRVHRSSPVQVDGGTFSGVQTVSTGYEWVSVGERHVIATKTDNTVWGWGGNDWYGQAGVWNKTNYSSPMRIRSENTGPWAKLSSQYNANVLLAENGLAYTWGYNIYGGLAIAGEGVDFNNARDQGLTRRRSSPVQVESGIQQFHQGMYNRFTVRNDGTLWGLGLASNARLGYGDVLDGYEGTPNSPLYFQTKSSPVQISSETGWKLANNSIGNIIFTARRGAGNTDFYQWGYDGQGRIVLANYSSVSNKSSPVQVESLTASWSNVSAGKDFVLATKPNGTLWSWGRNDWGQLGHGNLNHRSSPIQIGSANNWVSISAGNNHSIALNSSNNMYIWGDNTSYGFGTAGAHRSSPVQVGTDSWSIVSAGDNFTFGIKSSDQYLYGWGNNAIGQLGLTDINSGVTIHRSSPVLVGGNVSNWEFVTSGTNRNVIGLKTDGTLWAWGYNTHGLVGDNTTVHRSVPVQIGNANNWISISPERNTMFGTHVSVIDSSNTMYQWGANPYYQRIDSGPGTKVHRSSPTQVGDVFYGIYKSWTNVTASSNNIVAIASDGTLWSWGLNNYGTLGTNESLIVHRASPCQIGTANNWTQIANGNEHVLAINTSNNIYGWGRNDYGAIGDGTFVTRSSPVQVGTANDWIYIDASDNISIAINSNSQTYVWGDQS